MLKALVKTRLAALINQFTKKSSTKAKKSKSYTIIMGLVMIYVVVVFSFLFGMTFNEMSEPFHMAGIDWLYFTMMAITSFALMFVGSIFTTGSQLFEARDNEMLLAMPIPPKYILMSRMIMLFVLNMVFNFLVCVPGGIIYFYKFGFSVIPVLAFVIVFLSLPFLSMSLSAAVGFVVTKIAAHFKNKSAITTVFSLLFLAAYLYFYGNMNTFVSALIESGDVFAENIKSSALPLYWIGNSIASGNLLNLLVTVLMFIVPFVIVYMILSANFISIATTKRGFKKVKYKEKELKTSSVSTALFKKELAHFAKSPIYIMNGSIGCIFVLIFGFMLIFKGDIISTLTAATPELNYYVAPIIIFGLCFMGTLNQITAPSISLEGKNLWIAKALPVEADEIFNAKIKLHLAICVPCILFASNATIYTVDCSQTMRAITVLLPFGFTCFTAYLGLVINLKMPKFDWLSETVAIKQSGAVIVTMLIGFFAVLLPAGLFVASEYYGIVNAETFFSGFTVVIFAICFLLKKWLSTSGKKVFENL